jgi:hypothetical protein
MQLRQDALGMVTLGPSTTKDKLMQVSIVVSEPVWMRQGSRSNCSVVCEVSLFYEKHGMRMTAVMREARSKLLMD